MTGTPSADGEMTVRGVCVDALVEALIEYSGFALMEVGDETFVCEAVDKALEFGDFSCGDCIVVHRAFGVDFELIAQRANVPADEK